MTEPPRRPGLSTPVKLLLGCSLLGGGLAVLGGLAFIGGWVWLMGTGDQVPAQQVAGPEAKAILHFQGEPIDPGVLQFVDAVMSSFQEADRRRQLSETPEGARWLVEMQNQQRDPRQAANLLLPRDLAVVLDEVDGAPTWVLAANPRGMVRFFRSMVELVVNMTASEPSANKLEKVEIGGGEFYGSSGEDGVLFGTVGGTVVAGAGRAEVERAVETLSSPAGSLPVWDKAQALQGTWDVRGYLDNGTDLLHALLAAGDTPAEPPADPMVDLLEAGETVPPATQEGGVEAGSVPAAPSTPDTSAFREVWFGLDVVSADVWRARVETSLVDGASPADAALLLSGLCPAIVEAAAEHHAFATCDPSTSTPPGLFIEIRGIKEAILLLSTPPQPPVEEEMAWPDAEATE